VCRACVFDVHHRRQRDRQQPAVGVRLCRRAQQQLLECAGVNVLTLCMHCVHSGTLTRHHSSRLPATRARSRLWSRCSIRACALCVCDSVCEHVHSRVRVCDWVKRTYHSVAPPPLGPSSPLYVTLVSTLNASLGSLAVLQVTRESGKAFGSDTGDGVGWQCEHDRLAACWHGCWRPYACAVH
jgi:hypothetical protein